MPLLVAKSSLLFLLAGLLEIGAATCDEGSCRTPLIDTGGRASETLTLCNPERKDHDNESQNGHGLRDRATAGTQLQVTVGVPTLLRR